tara:strand:- start:815 stop:937 length:123 start_codon:yes stop_codon:yes gene_type:complete
MTAVLLPPLLHNPSYSSGVDVERERKKAARNFTMIPEQKS